MNALDLTRCFFFKNTLLLAAALISSTAFAEDRWMGPDKIEHVAVSAVSAVVVESLFSETLHPLARFGLAMAPGVIKELSDMRAGGSGFSGKDIAADALGVLSGMAFHGLVIRPNYVGINLKF